MRLAPGSEAAVAALVAPGLVVVVGGPGAGRSTALRRVGAAFRGPVFAGGGLASLSGVPALALARAVRAKLPADDPALLAEAVRSRVRGGLLLLDDLQWADPATVAALPAIAVHCRVAVALRTPHRLPAHLAAALREAATAWYELAPLTEPEATELARRIAPGLGPAAVGEVVRRAGGVPLAVEALARHAAARGGLAGAAGGRRADFIDAGLSTPDSGDRTGVDRPASITPAVGGPDELAYAVAGALADLTRPARTAMAALGLLGRPAPAAVLGAGAAELVAAGLAVLDPATGRGGAAQQAEGGAGDPPVVAGAAEPAVTGPAAPGGGAHGGPRTGPGAAAPTGPGGVADPPVVAGGDRIAPVSPYVAEVAAGLLDADARAALHRRLAASAPPREAARHLAAAGDHTAAYAVAVGAATTAVGADGTTAGERADLLLFAGTLPAATAQVRRDAAAAALATGRPRAALDVLDPADRSPDAAVLRGEALLHTGDPGGARHAVALAGPAGDRVRLLALLATDPTAALARADTVDTGTPGAAAAVAAVRAAFRTTGWESGLARAAEAAGVAGDALTARWSAWLLVETLAADGRLVEAARAAGVAAQACAADLAYSWQTRFLAVQLWCLVLRGDAVDDLVRRAGDLVDRTLPADARAYAVAATSLAEADGGLLAPARARLAEAGDGSPVLDWVAREAAWLDGQPAAAGGAPSSRLRLVDGLRHITAQWAAFDAAAPVDGCLSTPVPDDRTGVDRPPSTDGEHELPAVRDTLDAWAARDPDRFDAAAAGWHDLAAREEIRCLLAEGLLATDPAQAVPPLLAAEKLAEQAGLVVLRGRAQRGLRRHAVRRDVRGPRAGGDLTDRERDVLRLVARGEPTRRIAGQLGISGETVETHIRSGMRKLGARTRTEAAALAWEVL